MARSFSCLMEETVSPAHARVFAPLIRRILATPFGPAKLVLMRLDAVDSHSDRVAAKCGTLGLGA